MNKKKDPETKKIKGPASYLGITKTFEDFMMGFNGCLGSLLLLLDQMTGVVEKKNKEIERLARLVRDYEEEINKKKDIKP